MAGGRLQCAVRVIAASVLVVLAAIAVSGGSVVARSEAIDEFVRRIAAPLGMVVPVSPVSSGRGMDYPVIERIPLRGHTDVATGEPVPALVIWRQHTTAPDRVVPIALLLFVAGGLHAAAAVGWAWPRVVSGHPIESTRLITMALCVAGWTSPVAVLALSAYWPFVSFWGTAAYEAMDRRGGAAWIADTAITRAMVGAGLILGFCFVSLAIARVLVNRMLRRGALAGVHAPPSPAVCLVCGYSIDASMEHCPECGGSVDAIGRVAFIWPRVLGAPIARRRRVARSVVAAVVVGLLSAPLVIGLLRGVSGA